MFCPECFCFADVTDEDNSVNLARLREQAEFRKSDETFIASFQATCLNCGKVNISKLISNVKLVPTNE
jgi:hypothetical protein